MLFASFCCRRTVTGCAEWLVKRINSSKRSREYLQYVKGMIDKLFVGNAATKGFRSHQSRQSLCYWEPANVGFTHEV